MEIKGFSILLSESKEGGIRPDFAYFKDNFFQRVFEELKIER